MAQITKRRQILGTPQIRGTVWWIYNGTSTTQQLSRRGTNTAKASMDGKDVLRLENFIKVSRFELELTTTDQRTNDNTLQKITRESVFPMLFLKV